VRENQEKAFEESFPSPSIHQEFDTDVALKVIEI
jgi:hypothetical protein